MKKTIVKPPHPERFRLKIKFLIREWINPIYNYTLNLNVKTNKIMLVAHNLYWVWGLAIVKTTTTNQRLMWACLPVGRGWQKLKTPSFKIAIFLQSKNINKKRFLKKGISPLF
ncbi:MAG: hypothetical protein PHY32_03535 [Candidatus Pacebacteria bacterium]|jgi:hypothetical protein|nr:hypothetical protein [Candidatus Paceibacterota bacterium]